MSLADELLNSVAEAIPEHDHIVSDSDTYFIIDPITRQIENVNSAKNVIMQYDHNSERFTFELPRYVDGHDMLECTSVTVNVDNIEIGVDEPRINSDAPDMTDLRAHPNNPDKVISSWLVSRNSTQLPGILSFHIEYKCVDSNGNVVYEWSTDSYDGIEIRPRKKNGSAAVLEYNDVLEQWRSRIFGAGDTVMANIETEGKNQVAAVKMESETQQEAVELKGANTLASIPEDYIETSSIADEAVRSKADAIVCEAAGESIVLKDSSNDHVRGLKLFGKSSQVTTTGKNLLNVDENLSFTGLREKTVNIPAGTYVLTWAGRITAGQNKPVVRFADNSVLIDLLADVGDTKVTLVKDETTIYIYSNGYDYTASENVSASITQLMLSVDGGIYEPYTGGIPAPNPEYPQELVSIENPTVSVCGKNLLIARGPNKSASGVTFTVNADNSITINGVSTDATFFNIDMESPITYQGVNMIGSLGGGNNAVYMTIGYFDKDGAFIDTFVTIGNEEKEFVYPQDAVTSRVYIFVNNATTFDNVTVYPTIRIASVYDDKYEIGKEPQSIAINRTLHGIPVTSGGNYTDHDGQQWICDEIDLERGVHIQRIFSKTFTDFSEAINYNLDGNGTSCAMAVGLQLAATQGMCSCLPLTINTTGNDRFNPVDGVIYFKLAGEFTVEELKNKLAELSPTVVAILKTPIESPLTTEEIAAFKTLRTNRHNTTILNDAGAWMSVKYNADTKTYVENPRVLKLTDSSTGVVYELKIVDGNVTINPV